MTGPATGRLILTGGVLCALALALIPADPAALAGWLAALAYWAGMPIGGLCLVLMIRLIPGAWRQELSAPLTALLPALPLALAASVPLLVGLAGLYPWSAGPDASPSTAYLSPWPFRLRTLGFFAVAGLVALLLTRRWRPGAVAAVGLILLVPLHTMLADDWLMSLDRDFHSSGFGLYLLAIQMSAALALVVLTRLRRPADAAVLGLLGGLLLTAALLWAYFAFMPYFINWSENLPAGAAWYRRHAAGGWSLAAVVAFTLGLVPIPLLLAPPVRRSRRGLRLVAGAMLLARALELVWLVLPLAPGRAAVALIAALAGLTGLGALSAAVTAGFGGGLGGRTALAGSEVA